VTSIGRTPTFGGDAVVIEAHVFAELGELYGRRLGLDFVERIRGQQRFESPAALIDQIARDVVEAKRILGAEDAS
jgi:riboflavin kinase/FMN adenylyltransferase